VVESRATLGALAAALLTRGRSSRRSFSRGAHEVPAPGRRWFLRRDRLVAARGIRPPRLAVAAARPRRGRVPATGRSSSPGARLGYLVRSPGLAAFPILRALAPKDRIGRVRRAKSCRLAGESYAVGSLFLRPKAPSGARLDRPGARRSRTGTTFIYGGVSSAWTARRHRAHSRQGFVTWEARAGRSRDAARRWIGPRRWRSTSSTGSSATRSPFSTSIRSTTRSRRYKRVDRARCDFRG